MKRKAWSPNDIDRLRRIYGTMPAIEMPPIIGHSVYSIRDKASKLGLRSDQQRLANTKYDVNELFFEEKNLVTCYWAGFIAADGNISKKQNRCLCINLGSKDVEHLCKFKEIVEYTGPIIPAGSTNALYIYRPKLAESLLRHFNITPAKSLTLVPPSLSGDKALSFIKGYIDGDGCLHINKKGKLEISILGTEAMLIWIRSHFVKILKHEPRSNVRLSRKGAKCFSYKITGKDAVIVGRKLKSLDTDSLARKWCKVP